MSDRRSNPLLYEVDGDFNPGWLLFIVFATLGAGLSLGAVVVAFRSEGAWPAAVAALSFVAFAMLCTAIIVVPIARAKLLAPALKGAAESIGGPGMASPRLQGVDVRFTDDESGA